MWTTGFYYLVTLGNGQSTAQSKEWWRNAPPLFTSYNKTRLGVILLATTIDEDFSGKLAKYKRQDSHLPWTGTDNKLQYPPFRPCGA